MKRILTAAAILALLALLAGACGGNANTTQSRPSRTIDVCHQPGHYAAGMKLPVTIA